MNDLNTRRFPRTMCEAFGPYTSDRIDEPEQRSPLHEKVTYFVCLFCLVAVVFIVVE